MQQLALPKLCVTPHSEVLAQAPGLLGEQWLVETQAWVPCREAAGTLSPHLQLQMAH